MYFLDLCEDLGPLISIIKGVVKLVQFGIPFLLILFGVIDLGKAVISSKEDEMKKAQSTLIKRVIYAVAVFLVVTIVTAVMGLVGDANVKDGVDNENWLKCWRRK